MRFTNERMELTSEQLNAAKQGELVKIEADGESFVLLSRAVYDDELDYSPWMSEEIVALADEAAELVSGDDFDDTDE